jgi:Development and cell death domain
MSEAGLRVFVFQCSSNTYMECIEKSVFGSNDPWPLQVKKGDHCLLHHYEYDSLFALWRAESDGGKKLVAKAWGGKFPFQVRVGLVTPRIVELPKGSVGSHERILEGPRAGQVLRLLADLGESKRE